VTRVHLPGAPPARRDRAAALTRALVRRRRAAHAVVARGVARQPDQRLERLIGPVVVWALPLALRAGFRPEYAVDFDHEDIEAVIALNLLRRDGRRIDSFDVVIAERRCRIRRHRASGGRPDAALTARVVDLLRMLVAATDPLALASDERLAMTGDTFLLVRFPAMFGQPTRSVV
jgi:SCP-2 sterol transfer family